MIIHYNHPNNHHDNLNNNPIAFFLWTACLQLPRGVYRGLLGANKLTYSRSLCCFDTVEMCRKLWLIHGHQVPHSALVVMELVPCCGWHCHSTTIIDYLYWLSDCLRAGLMIDESCGWCGWSMVATGHGNGSWLMALSEVLMDGVFRISAERIAWWAHVPKKLFGSMLYVECRYHWVCRGWSSCILEIPCKQSWLVGNWNLSTYLVRVLSALRKQKS